MSDTEFLQNLFSNISSELEKLNNFEGEVIQRPDYSGKNTLLEDIQVNRKKLCDLANNVSRL